jgi:hypothetical protein
MIAEQWIHRHWECPSPYRHLPIDRLRWREEKWPTEAILQNVYSKVPATNDESNFEEFCNSDYPPMSVFRSIGTWDYPIVVLETPAGALVEGHRSFLSYCLIEGHQRFKFLKAWHGRAPLAEKHSLFILTL